MTEIATCCFTGHRPRSFSFGYDENCDEFRDLHSRMKNAIIQVCNAGCRKFYCGMAEGVDLWCAEIVLDLAKCYTPSPVVVPVVPYLKQPSGMTEQNKMRYYRVMKAATERYLVSGEYKKNCFLRRNRFLVDSSDAVIAVFKEKEEHSGTAQTVRYAKKKNRKIFLVSV